MANKRKITTAIVAGVTAVALLLGGTFAWQSINQTALNEASDVINPGGRLHDDFNGSNKDVYVENFAEDPIYARIRLDEYFEIIMNKGVTGAERVDHVAGTKDEDGNIISWVTHKFDGNDVTKDYWEWTTGGSTIYMPTFNKNKDSLEADINGTLQGEDGVVKDEMPDDRYNDYVEYANGEDKTANAIYDIDANMTDELAETKVNVSELIDPEKTVAADYSSDYVSLVSEEHTAKTTLDATLISMADWMAAGSNPGEYWVYDTDGWVYWAQAIQPGTATGKLLDGIKLTQVMDDSWYYAINVVAQFVTADDVGKNDGTGFYDTANGTVPSDNALALLEKIGVQVDGEAGSGGSTEPDTPVYDDATLAIINEIATAQVVGSTASGGTGADIYNNAGSLQKVTIDGEQYFVLVRDTSTPGAERALLLKYESHSFYTPDGSGYEIYAKFGDSANWANSDVYALLNSTDPVTIQSAGYYSSDDEYGYEATVTPFLTENTTVAQIAIPTEISTRVYDDQGGYTYETTTCKVFTMSEADVNGTIGGTATSNTEDYTYVLNGQGVDLFEYALGGEYSGGALASYRYGWLRSVYSADTVGYMQFDGGVIGNYPRGGYEEWDEYGSTCYTYGYVYPMFWADISAADIYNG